MEEGPIREASYFYPAKRINKFMEGLPATDRFEPLYAHVFDKVVVMTHDDILDKMMIEREEELGIDSTFFLLPTAQDRRWFEKNEINISRDVDLALHFDKEHSTLKNQMLLFESKYGGRPIFNRTHRLFWRADNFDFPLLALNGFLVDSTKIGVTPYKPCICGKLLPIWEVPIAVSDVPANDSLMAVYNVAKNLETLFKLGVSPIVVNAHPKKIAKAHMMHSCYDKVLNCLSKYDYNCLNLTEFYHKYLTKQAIP